LARFGLVGGIDLVGSLLQQLADQGVGRLENGGAHQAFELLHSYSVGGRGLKTSHQLLDFLVLGEKEFGRGLFFFNPEASSARVFWMTNSAYCWVNC
jgi:hypothetical protein